MEGEAVTPVSEIYRRDYGWAICVIVLLNTFNLGLKCQKLSAAAKESMKKLTELLDGVDDVSVPRLVTTASDYKSARREGPLIPGKFKLYHEKSLQRIWDETLSLKENRDA